jgi:hypothetical protein
MIFILILKYSYDYGGHKAYKSYKYGGHPAPDGASPTQPYKCGQYFKVNVFI